MTILIILSTIFVLSLFGLILFLVVAYNNLVIQKELVENARGQIAVQIESRWDALTNLIHSARKYADHEAETLQKLVKERSTLSKVPEAREINHAETIYQSSLSRLIAITETHPNLQADETFKYAMNSLNCYERSVRLARMSYNDIVTKYNQSRTTIPTNIVASMMKFEKEPYFENSGDKKSMPK